MAKSKFVPYRVFVCFGDVDRSVPWDRLGYIAWQERAARGKSAQRPTRERESAAIAKAEGVRDDE